MTATAFRPLDPGELLAQIGMGNLLAISGGRVGPIYSERVGGDVIGVVLPVGHGYSVEVLLAADDTYVVRRVFVRAGRRFDHGERSNVYADEVGEVAYAASCYVNVAFP